MESCTVLFNWVLINGSRDYFILMEFKMIKCEYQKLPIREESYIHFLKRVKELKSEQIINLGHYRAFMREINKYRKYYKID